MALYEARHAPQRFFEQVVFLGVTDADKASPGLSEGRPRHDRHLFLDQEPFRELIVVQSGAADRGEGVESALWLDQRQAHLP